MEKKFALLFPGQGSQSVGMGYSLAAKIPEFKNIFLEVLREADAELGFPLSRLLQEGPSEKLKETDITQPALLTVSTAMSHWLKSKGCQGQVALGHSLGEYSALVHAEALSFKDAIKLVHLRGKLMQNAVPLGQGGMAALLGAQESAARELCKLVEKETGKVLEISALNAPNQIVLSGDKIALEKSVEMAKSFGIRKVIFLEVSGPFHCSLLKEAGEKFSETLQTIEIFSPSIPVISNTTAKPHTGPESIRENLVLQISKTVKWQESVQFVIDQGITDFIEVGSGHILSGLVSKINSNAKTHALDLVNDLSFLEN